MQSYDDYQPCLLIPILGNDLLDRLIGEDFGKRTVQVICETLRVIAVNL